MSVKLGSTGIAEMYLGSTKIAEAYLGSVKIFGGSAPTPTPTVFYFAPASESIEWQPSSGGDTPVLFHATAPSTETISVTVNMTAVENQWWASNCRLCVLINGTVSDYLDVPSANNGYFGTLTKNISVTAGDAVTIQGIKDELTNANQLYANGTITIHPNRNDVS